MPAAQRARGGKVVYEEAVRAPRAGRYVMGREASFAARCLGSPLTIRLGGIRSLGVLLDGFSG